MICCSPAADCLTGGTVISQSAVASHQSRLRPTGGRKASGCGWRTSGSDWHVTGSLWNTAGSDGNAVGSGWNTAGIRWHRSGSDWHTRGSRWHVPGSDRHTAGSDWQRPSANRHLKRPYLHRTSKRSSCRRSPPVLLTSTRQSPELTFCRL